MFQGDDWPDDGTFTVLSITAGAAITPPVAKLTPNAMAVFFKEKIDLKLRFMGFTLSAPEKICGMHAVQTRLPQSR